VDFLTHRSPTTPAQIVVHSHFIFKPLLIIKLFYDISRLYPPEAEAQPGVKYLNLTRLTCREKQKQMKLIEVD
jgi:hypothetical protein